MAREMRKPNRATRTAAGVLLLFWDLRLLVRHASSNGVRGLLRMDPVVEVPGIAS